MVLELFRRLFGRQEVDDYGRLRPGRAAVRGTIRGGDDLVRSPLKGLTCVAFYYRAVYAAQARGKTVDRVVKEAEVYAPSFSLAMEGGVLRVVAPRSAPFTAAEHRELLGGGLRGLQTTEQVIRPGSRVRLHGRVVREGDGLVLHLRQIDLLPTEETEAGPYRRPPPRKKRRRKPPDR